MNHTSRGLNTSQLRQLAEDMTHAGDGTMLDAAVIARLEVFWQPIVRPTPKEQEPFDLVDPTGQPAGVTAPRWLCHLLGLCHRTVHLILHTPQGLLVLQMRSRQVRNWPGHLDLAVTGHVRAGQSWEEAIRREAAEELGLDVTPAAGMLKPPGLLPIDLYCRREADSVNPPEHICHVTRVYEATLTPDGLASLRFADGEVDGMYLCTLEEARRLIAHEPQRVAPGLAQSLPRYLGR